MTAKQAGDQAAILAKQAIEKYANDPERRFREHPEMDFLKRAAERQAPQTQTKP